MPNINEAYPSRYLSVEDLQGRHVRVVIDRAEVQVIGQGANAERKLVATLVGKKKEFVINKTNAKAIAQWHGEDYAAWQGKTITLGPRQVEFQGETVWAIRVDTPMPGAAGQGATQVEHVAPLPPKPAPAPKPAENLDEDVPF